jgi:L-arabinonolactonase
VSDPSRCARTPITFFWAWRGGVALYRLSTGATTAIVPVEADQPTTRINDGRCDRQGRFVFGMYVRGESPIGNWYRVHPDLRIERLPLPPTAVANSTCFSLDGRRMYHADSPGRTVWVRDYHEDGRIGPAEVMVRLEEAHGFPDGACVDAADGLWIACWEGRAVRRYDVAGRLTDVVDLPVSRVTSLAFGGAALDRIYVTTARIGLRADRLLREPQAGGLFAFDSRYRGVSEARFRGATGGSPT